MLELIEIFLNNTGNEIKIDLNCNTITLLKFSKKKLNNLIRVNSVNEKLQLYHTFSKSKLVITKTDLKICNLKLHKLGLILNDNLKLKDEFELILEKIILSGD